MKPKFAIRLTSTAAPIAFEFLYGRDGALSKIGTADGKGNPTVTYFVDRDVFGKPLTKQKATNLAITLAGVVGATLGLGQAIGVSLDRLDA